AYSAATKKALTTINVPIRRIPHTRCDARSTQTFPVRVSCCASLPYCEGVSGANEVSHHTRIRFHKDINDCCSGTMALYKRRYTTLRSMCAKWFKDTLCSPRAGAK